MVYKTYLNRGRVALPMPSVFKNKHELVLKRNGESLIVMSLHKYKKQHKHFKHLRLSQSVQFNVNDKPASRTKFMKFGKVQYL